MEMSHLLISYTVSLSTPRKSGLRSSSYRNARLSVLYSYLHGEDAASIDLSGQCNSLKNILHFDSIRIPYRFVGDIPSPDIVYYITLDS
jgi:hypothetical protein